MKNKKTNSTRRRLHDTSDKDMQKMGECQEKMSNKMKKECCLEVKRNIPFLYETCLVDHCSDGNHRECIPEFLEVYKGFLLYYSNKENNPPEFLADVDIIDPLKYPPEMLP